MKKLKTRLIALTKFSLICLAFFVFSPSLKVHAMFSDTANINMGIQLKLGTVSLASENTTISNAVNFTEGDSVLMASSTLTNDGSLSGKLAYKIDLTKDNGTLLTAEEIKDMSVIVNFDTVAKEVMASAAFLNTNSFTFAKNTSGSAVIIEPSSIGKVPVTIKYKSSSPTKDEKLKVTVTFRLIQSNAADANAELFSDEETLANTVTLVPKVIEEKSYWPDISTFVKAGHGNYTYSVEKMKMLFSETNNMTNPNKRYIKNLNKAVVYIQLPSNEPLTKQIIKKNGTKEIKQMFNISKLSTGNTAIKYESMELDEEHHGIILTFKLEDSYSYNPDKPEDSLAYENKDRYELNLNIEIQKYGMYEAEKYGYYDNSHTYDQYFATRLVLSSDTDVPVSGANYAQLPIKLTTDKKLLSFKNFYTTSPQYVKPGDFKDVQLTKENIELEVIGEKSGQISSLLNSNKTFSLWLNSNETLDTAVLNVKILGDAGNTLVISRTLKNGTSSSTNAATTQSTSIKSMSALMIVEETEEPTEQAIGSEKSVEVPDSAIDKATPDEQAVDSSIEESDAEQVADKAEVVEETKETVDSSSVESVAESIKEPDQSAPVEPINNE
ncbi:hypothetical protein [Carnobacterium alterfunditum]|uniref:hypothetical protein n=1 Tax=Carnobacterium alterfunditum TaxID=28230 RepID=UPI003593278A